MIKNKKKWIIILMVLILILGVIRIVTLEESTTKSTVKGTISNFDASSTITKTINGIKYQINPNDNSATVLQIAAYDQATCTFNPKGSNDVNKATFCINIPETIGYSINNVTTRRATVRYIGDGTNGIFGGNIIAFLDNMHAEQLVVIFNKSVVEVKNAAVSEYGKSAISNLRLVALSNNIEFKTGSIHTKANLPVKVVSVPGTKTDAVKSVSGVTIVPLYDVTKNTSNKTVTIKGFYPNEVFKDTCDARSSYTYDKNAVLINIKFPERMTIDGTEYTVTEIAPYAFKDNTRFKNIFIPSTIETLNPNAFTNSYNYITIENIFFLNKNTEIAKRYYFLWSKDKIPAIYGLSGSTAETYAKETNLNNADGSISKHPFHLLKVKSISVRKQPIKTTYQTGETLDATGLELNAIFESTTGVTAGGIITKGYTVTPTALNTAGKQTITVNYEGAKTTLIVDVEGSQKVELLSRVPVRPTTATGRTEVYLGSDYNLYLDSDCTRKMTPTANNIDPSTEAGKMFKGYVADEDSGLILIDENGYLSEDVNVSEELRKIGTSVTLTGQWEDMKLTEVQLSPAGYRDRIYLGKDYNLYLDEECKLKMTSTENNVTIPHKEGYIYIGYGIGEDGNVLIDENGYAIPEVSSVLRQMRWTRKC